MKFLDELEKVLGSDERFLGENNQIIKTKVSDAARSMDASLIKSLLNNDLLRESFFVKVDEVYVFDQTKFVWVLESKEFLPDSYTLYKNKIGLVDAQDNLISQKQDVTLVWPYKDCVLEGGQTKDDEKRDEIFYNEILAPDQVNRLLAPKVFGNAKRYTADGIEEDIEFQDDDNLIIKGNNLLALSSLLKRYKTKVKLVYIDPPYNTQSAANTFSYNNTFNHSTWLTFMKNRIELSKRMLRPDGIFVASIDDNELFYLGVLLDEIFGKENRLGVLAVVHNPGGRQDEEFFPTAHENMIVYANDKKTVKLNNLPISEEKLKEYKYSDELGRYKLRGFRRSGNNSLRTERPLLYYPIYADIETGELSLESFSNSVEILPVDSNGDERCWRWGKETFLKRKNEYIELVSTSDGYDLYVKERERDYEGEKPKTIWRKPEYSGQNATSNLKRVLGKKAFSYPKSEFLMRDIIEVCSNEHDLIFDFFAGSSTTQSVALKMNRQFIGVEQMDYIKDVSVERLKKVLKGDDSGISKDVNWQGGGSFVYCELLEDNQSLINQIQDADNIEFIKEILRKAIGNGKLVSTVLPSDLEKTEEEFDALSLQEQKNLALKLLDKNKLYVNLSDIEDADMAVNEADKIFTKSFYNLDKGEGHE